MNRLELDLLQVRVRPSEPPTVHHVADDLADAVAFAQALAKRHYQKRSTLISKNHVGAITVSSKGVADYSLRLAGSSYERM